MSTRTRSLIAKSLGFGLLAMLLLAFSIAGSAQSDNTQISGFVKDQAGGVHRLAIPGQLEPLDLDQVEPVLGLEPPQGRLEGRRPEPAGPQEGATQGTQQTDGAARCYPVVMTRP